MLLDLCKAACLRYAVILRMVAIYTFTVSSFFVIIFLEKGVIILTAKNYSKNNINMRCVYILASCGRIIEQTCQNDGM